jgi:BirA family biotin operon repressor/biotin-[acetyl-CoA-carboxylase] ligase
VIGTRQAVLAALRSTGAVGVSGEALAVALGVSRVAIAKHVSALREAGYAIDATPGKGYILVSAPDLPLPDEVSPLLATGEFWRDLTGGRETGSTNDDARELARSGAPEGTVVLAARQLRGRGRLGREWASPGGGVYLSAVLRPAVAPAEVPSLALAVALGVAIGLERLGVEPRLKWPNDVLLGEGKLAGILLEMSAESDRVDWVVAGIGMNVRRPATEAAPNAAYVADVLPGARLAQVAAAELDGIAETYARWRAGGFAGLVRDYEGRSALAGSEVAVRDLTGEVRAEGTVDGVDDDGRLLVREAAGSVTRVVAGEVTLRG